MSNQPTAEEAVNSLVMEVRILEGTYNELSARQNLLERALLESRAALDAIKGLGEKPSDEVLVQIGGGAMLRSPAPSPDRVLVSIGTGVVIEKPRAEALAILETRVKDIERTVISISNQRNEIAERLNADRSAINSLIGNQSEE